MPRISREQLFIEMCHLLAKRSTCYRQNVGALLTFQSRVVSTGFNGPGPGEAHCHGHACDFNACGGCVRAIHAEINALSYAPHHLDNLEMYVSLSPCLPCSQAIVASKKVVRLFYNQEYRIKDGLDFLIESGIDVYRITNAGHIINAKTQEML